MVKRKPQRTCLGCRTSKDKNELIRIVRSPEGTVSWGGALISAPTAHVLRRLSKAARLIER